MFFGASSYIARGPLSLIAQYNQKNIMYYRPGKTEDLLDSMAFAVCMYKYIKEKFRMDYNQKITQKFRRGNFVQGEYLISFAPMRDDFMKASALASMLLMKEASFAELIRMLRISPSELKSILKNLFDEGRIEKTASLRYRSVNGFADKCLHPFSTTKLSRRRAHRVAYA
ncbi:MAG: hypothetical protein AB7O49_14085 [Sphingomonadales bacterium]